MTVVLVLLFLIYKTDCFLTILPKTEDNGNDLVKCVKNIVEKYYEGTLTYVDFNAEENGILGALNKSPTVTIVTRKPEIKIKSMNGGYLINVKDITHFLEYFDWLQKEPDWSPSVRFVIIMDKLSDMNKIFNKLLKLHIFHVLLINGTNQANIYTYNPYEKFACGKFYDRVISYGSCALPLVSDFFPKMLESGFRNCTINMAVSHLPPFTIKPDLCESKVKEYCVGIEQYAFNMISEREHFDVNYTFIDFAEKFSNIDENMMAIGSFSLIQLNKTDGLFGFTFLSNVRAQAFNYIYQHLAYKDQLVYVVKQAGLVPVWKCLYLEFQSTVWIVLFTAFVTSTALLIFIAKPKNKASMLLKIWDSLFLHGFSVHEQKITMKFFLTVWMCFAFLINSFYQSSLMSLTTHPSEDFQISTEEDLVNAKVRPCILPALKNFLNSYAEMKIEGNEGSCLELISGMEKVSKSYKVYTITTESIYKYNSALFSSEETKIYRLEMPVMNAVYALYLYKGFPRIKTLEMHALRLRENGLIDRHAENIRYYSKKIYEKEARKPFKARIVVPWGLLLVGSVIATFTFILEVLRERNKYNHQQTVIKVLRKNEYF